MSKTGKFIWKFDKYFSRVVMNKQDEHYYSPVFYSSQFGYKLQLLCLVNKEYVDFGITTRIGEYDSLLKWPLIGNITITILDQSQWVSCGVNL